MGATPTERELLHTASESEHSPVVPSQPQLLINVQLVSKLYIRLVTSVNLSGPSGHQNGHNIERHVHVQANTYRTDTSGPPAVLGT